MPPIVKNIFVNNVQKEIKHFPYSQILLPAKREPIIPITSNTYTVREHSNIIYSETLGKYVYCWSQGPKPYDSTDIYVHMAISDNIDFGWQIIGKIIPVPSEDPFIVEENGTLYILFENKVNVGGIPDDIGLYKLTDTNDLLNGWSSLGYGLQKDPSKEWQDFDISSPTYFRENGVSYIFFEGRGTSNSVTQGGAIGLATSTGIEDVFTHENLIISGTGFDGRTPDFTWGTHVVPDDVFVINGNYYMTAHVFTTFGNEAYTAVFSSDSVDSGWVDVFGCEINYSNKITNANGQGVNFYDGKAFVIENNEVFLARWGVGHKNTPFLKDITEKSNTTNVKLIGNSFFIGKNDNDFAQVRDIKESEASTFRNFREVYLSGDFKFYLDRPLDFLIGVYVNGDFIDEDDLEINKDYGIVEILSVVNPNDIVNIKYKSDNSTMLLSYDTTTSLNLNIRTISGLNYNIDWGDGIWESKIQDTYVTKNFGTPTTGVARVRADISKNLKDFYRFLNGVGRWSFNISTLNTVSNRIYISNDTAKLKGSINSLSKEVNYILFRVQSSMLTCKLKEVPKTIKQFYLDSNLSEISGDISDLNLTNLQKIEIKSSISKITYTSSSWGTIPSLGIDITLGAGFLTSTEIDQMLIDLANVSVPGESSTIDLRGSNQPPTAASLTAINTLTNNGNTVLTN